MTIIDYINDLDWDCTKEAQQAAIDYLTKSIRESHSDASLIMQTPFKKQLWHNEAKIICAQEDIVLERYMTRLLEWLMDWNWPGADLIFDRIVQIKGKYVETEIIRAKRWASLDNDTGWMDTLDELHAQWTAASGLNE